MAEPALTLVPPPELEQLDALPEAWQVATLEDADFALSRVADMEKEIAENDHLAGMAVARIQLKTQLLNERVAKGIAFFRSRIQAFAEANRELLLKGGKRKSRNLLNGSIGWKAVPERVKVVDPDAVMKWATSLPVESDMVRTKEELNKTALNEHYKKTGEVPPGVEVEPAREDLVVKASEKGE